MIKWKIHRRDIFHLIYPINISIEGTNAYKGMLISNEGTNTLSLSSSFVFFPFLLAENTLQELNPTKGQHYFTELEENSNIIHTEPVLQGNQMGRVDLVGLVGRRQQSPITHDVDAQLQEEAAVVVLLTQKEAQEDYVGP